MMMVTMIMMNLLLNAMGMMLIMATVYDIPLVITMVMMIIIIMTTMMIMITMLMMIMVWMMVTMKNGHALK